VDAHRPHHGDIHPRQVLLLGRRAAGVAAVEDIEWNGQIQRQVPVQDDHVPREQRARPVEKADPGRQVPGGRRIAEIHHHKSQRHHQRGHGDSLGQQHRPAEVHVFQDVGRQHQHHGGRGQPDQEREVGDVEPPAHVIAHAAHPETVPQLAGVGDGADQHDQRQRAHP
jgi:hypothetical protein